MEKMIITEIRERLFSLRDEKYLEFQKKLIPGVDGERILGVRVPIIRKLAREYAKREDIDAFLSDLPHKYCDEDSLHGIIISEYKDYDKVKFLLDEFLPYVDNWATCDIISPKAFIKNKSRLKNDIETYLSSDKTYVLRFGIEMAMSHFLDDDFDISLLQRISIIKSDEYYVKMMIAWYFATALAKKWEPAFEIIKKGVLDEWVHNKAIQKSIESYRITDEQKVILRKLKSGGKYGKNS